MFLSLKNYNFFSDILKISLAVLRVFSLYAFLADVCDASSIERARWQRVPLTGGNRSTIPTVKHCRVCWFYVEDANEIPVQPSRNNTI